MKVLVLSGRFGMGHEMAANAICEQFRKIDEQAEIEMLKDAILICLKKGKVKKEEIDLYFGGDLNNQITACYYYANHLHRPFIGLYSACSTIGLALANASIMIENHMKRHDFIRAAVISSSVASILL